MNPKHLPFHLFSVLAAAATLTLIRSGVDCHDAERERMEDEKREATITECHERYCYHLLDDSQSVVHVWSRFGWKRLPELEKLCHESAGPAAHPLEIYREEEQSFVAGFVGRHNPSRRAVVAPIVPLNLNVSRLDDWTWLTGKKLRQTRSIIFGGNLRNLSGSHFATIRLNNNTFTCDQSPSFFSLHRAICEIKLESCDRLSTTLSVDGYCFLVAEELFSWHQAREFCKNKGGDLASFETDRKIATFLLNFASAISYTLGYWIGLTSIQEVWLKENEPVVYANWGSIDLSAVNYSNEIVNLNLERERWFPILPMTFEMKIVCMTERDFFDHHESANLETVSTNHPDHTCHSSIWLGVILSLVLSGLVILCVIYGLERRRWSRRSQDQQVIFEKTAELSSELPYSNFSEEGSNPSV